MSISKDRTVHARPLGASPRKHTSSDNMPVTAAGRQPSLSQLGGGKEYPSCVSGSLSRRLQPQFRDLFSWAFERTSFLFSLLHFSLLGVTCTSFILITSLRALRFKMSRSLPWVRRLILFCLATTVLANELLHLRVRQEESIQPFTGAIGGLAAPAVRLLQLRAPCLRLSQSVALIMYTRYRTRETWKGHTKSHPTRSPTSPPQQVEPATRRRTTAPMLRTVGVGLRFLSVRLKMVRFPPSLIYLLLLARSSCSSLL